MKTQKIEAHIKTKFGSFLCFFDSNNQEKGFTVTSPAVQGFVTYGPTLTAAKKMAKNGLEFHYECTLLEQCAPRTSMLQYA